MCGSLSNILVNGEYILVLMVDVGMLNICANQNGVISRYINFAGFVIFFCEILGQKERLRGGSKKKQMDKDIFHDYE